MKHLFWSISTAFYLLIMPMAVAQDDKDRKEDKDAWKRERKEDKDDRKRKGRGKWKTGDDEASRAGNRSLRLPRLPGRYPRNTPRQVASVPKGHYPPPGMCRLWFPNLPPGQQRPPQPCGELQRLSFGDGAFILYNEKAYDMDYDWRRREAQRRNSVPRDILDFYRERD